MAEIKAFSDGELLIVNWTQASYICCQTKFKRDCKKVKYLGQSLTPNDGLLTVTLINHLIASLKCDTFRMVA